MNRHLVLLFILILTVSILFVVKPAYSSISTPSVPEFTATISDSSEYVPKVYSLDRSTGDIVADEAYISIAKTIRLTIENQPFTPYHDDDSGWDIHFYYNVRIKGHSSETWSVLYRASEGFPGQHSDSQYTTITHTLKASGTNDHLLADGSRIDIQVEAMIGYVSRIQVSNATDMFFMFPWAFTGETSGWSETQTLTVPASPKIVTPEISIFSPYNVTHSQDDVSLVFSVTGETSWMGYSLDGQNNVTMTKKTLNLTKSLANGSHTLTVYANGTYPDTETSKTVTFTINKEAETLPQPEPQQPNYLIVITAIASAAVVAAIIVGIQLRRTKRK